MRRIHRAILIVVILVIVSCTPGTRENSMESLPKLGRFEINEDTNSKSDTLYHKVSDFKFISQLGDTVSLKSFEDDIFVADFFFTTCPDICPKMTAQMNRVYDEFESDDEIRFLSHTIDPKHDSAEVLFDYAERLEVDHNKWVMVTGDKSKIYKQGQVSYMASISDDPEMGLTHSGRFFLVDKERHIRGAYDGTNEIEVNDLIRDIKRLKNEYK